MGVQREALLVANETDYRDLVAFTNELTTTREDRRRYGFLYLPIEDSRRTMHQEADVTHKRKMTGLMRKAYQRAVEKLGGVVEHDTAKLQGWRFQMVNYHDRPLGEGHTIETMSIAPGVPMKDLADSHPGVYEELSGFTLLLENMAQEDLDAPIDKDRMPGQILVDVATRTVTLLDQGQASILDGEVRLQRDPFIGSSLSANVTGLKKILQPLGIHLNLINQARLGVHLANVPLPYRPLETLGWLWRSGFISDKNENNFWDLVHAVRAKLRLGQWAEDLKNPLIHDEWTKLGRSHASVSSVAVDLCRRATIALGRARDLLDYLK